MSLCGHTPLMSYLLLIIARVISANAKLISLGSGYKSWTSEVFHATTLDFLFPGLRVVVVGVRLHQLQQHGSCRSHDRKRSERVLFDLVLQVLVEAVVLHDFPFFDGSHYRL